jgi:hypothetical protein
MIGFGQEWIRIYNNINEDFSYGISNIQQTLDFNFSVFTGIGLMKINNNGDTLWNKEFANFYTYDGIQHSDGGYILAGRNSNTNDGCLYKLNNLGNIEWIKIDSLYPSNNITIKETIDGGYFLTGENKIAKTDSLGNILWNSIYSQYSIFDGDIVSNNNYIVTGRVFDSALLSQINQLGDTIWTKEYLFFDRTVATSVVENALGNFVFTGYVDIKDIDGFIISRKLLIAESNSNGDVIWTKIYEGGERAESFNIEITNDGGYIICGKKDLPNNEDVLWLLKTDNQGDTLWTRTFGNPYGIGIAVKQLSNNGYIITGGAYQNSYDASIIVIKTNPNGNVTSTFNIPINPNRKLEKTVDLLGRETKGTKNEPLLYLYDDGTVEKRIVIE